MNNSLESTYLLDYISNLISNSLLMVHFHIALFFSIIFIVLLITKKEIISICKKRNFTFSKKSILITETVVTSFPLIALSILLSSWITVIFFYVLGLYNAPDLPVTEYIHAKDLKWEEINIAQRINRITESNFTIAQKHDLLDEILNCVMDRRLYLAYVLDNVNVAKTKIGVFDLYNPFYYFNIGIGKYNVGFEPEKYYMVFNYSQHLHNISLNLHWYINELIESEDMLDNVLNQLNPTHEIRRDFFFPEGFFEFAEDAGMLNF